MLNKSLFSKLPKLPTETDRKYINAWYLSIKGDQKVNVHQLCILTSFSFSLSLQNVQLLSSAHYWGCTKSSLAKKNPSNNLWDVFPTASQRSKPTLFKTARHIGNITLLTCERKTNLKFFETKYASDILNVQSMVCIPTAKTAFL